MLMRPPTITDQNDNLSHFNTESDAKQSSKSKNKVKRKQTSISIKNRNPSNGRESQQKQTQKQQDNGSVHSHGSARSKRSKKKQSSIGLSKPRGAYMTLNSPIKNQEQEGLKVIDYANIVQYSQKKNDNHAIQYSQVKNDYLGPNINIRQTSTFNNLFPNSRTNDKYSFRNVFQNGPELIKQQSSKQSIDDQVPVVKLVEQKNINIQNYSNISNNVVSPKMIQRRQTKKLGQLFEENRRNIQNQSLGVSGIPSEVGNSGLGGESRRSRSKLGQLFKQRSKQKQISNSSKVQFSQNASSNYQSISDLHLNLQSNIEGPRKIDGGYGFQNPKGKDKQNVGRINNIPQKVLEQSGQHFQEQQQINKSDLNLSLSRNSPFMTKLEHNRFNDINNKDSVCFNLEPEKQKKRKGLGLASKLNASQDQLIKVSGNLVSKQLTKLDAHQRLRQNLNQNQKYLIESGAIGGNDFYQQEQKKEEKEKQQQIRLLRQKQQERKKQENKKYEQSLRKQEEKRRYQRIKKQQELKRKRQEERKMEQQRIRQQKKIQQQRHQEKRLKLQQHRQQKILQIERQKQKQIQQKRLKQKQAKKQKQLEIKRLKQLQEEQQAIRQRQKLKIAYHKQRQQIRRSHQQAQIQKSYVQELENDSYNQPKKISKKQTSLSKLPSSFSRQSSCVSQKSQQSRKSTKKKQSVITKNKTKHYVGEISPRAEQSFYQQPKQAEKFFHKEQKAQKAKDQPRKLMSFSEQQDFSYEPKPQYKTDTYFYDKSLKAPSSKPPLSRKSSASKSKPKQGMILKKSPKDSQVKIRSPDGANCQKKLSLVQLAMRKNYQPGSGSENQSQDSFRSRQKSVESFGSRNSSGSRASRKKQSVIQVKQNKLNNFTRPPLQKKNSSQNQDSLKNRTWRHEEQMQQQSQYSTANRITEVQSKVRVIKGCSFIDQRGRLVQNGNMMIKNNQLSGTSRKNQFNQKKMIERLMNSREKRRSRSRQRSLNRSRNSSRSNEKNNSKSFNANGQAQKPFAESEAYSETQGRYQSSDSNYYGRTDQSYYQNNGANRTYFGNSQYKNQTPQNLQQFIKPIQEAGITRIKNQTQNIYYDREKQVNKKRTMQRTEKRW